MSLRTRVNGFTAWVNLRMKEYGVNLGNVMLDLMAGTNLKILTESMTGRELKTVQSFEGYVSTVLVSFVVCCTQWIDTLIKRLTLGRHSAT